jgi:O-antigen ligase
MTASGGIAQVDQPALSRGVVLGGALAFLLSATAILVLTYGLIGISGSPLFTAAYFAACEAAVFLIAVRRINLLPADYLFGAFILCIFVSSVLNGRTTDVKGMALLSLAVAAYPACRCVRTSSLGDVRTGFMSVTTTVAIVGAVVTLLAIIDQWPVPRGKPIILGFDATTNFLSALGFVILVVATERLTRRRAAIFFALVLLPVAIFAASMVRFTFVAIICALLLEAFLSAGRQRLHVVIIIVGVLASVAVGLAVRYDTTRVLMDYAVEKIETTPARPSTLAHGIVPPSCNLGVNQRNSVSIRKALYQDAFYMIPKAGLFGFGIDSFLSLTCVIGHQVHNSFLQATIEFGWLGGLSLALLIVAASIRLLPLARQDAGARFVLCAIAYVTLMSMAHGRTSHDPWLFGLIGLAVGLTDLGRKGA